MPSTRLHVDTHHTKSFKRNLYTALDSLIFVGHQFSWVRENKELKCPTNYTLIKRTNVDFDATTKLYDFSIGHPSHWTVEH